MCNEQRRRIALGQIRDDFSQIRIPLRFPEGLPNLAALDSIRITDPNAIIRASADEEGAAELVVRRWSWPGPGGKPVYNYRSDGREFTRGRCLIVADGFYEFTAPPPPPPGQPKPKRKDKWLFTKADEEWFCIAGLWRADPAVGEAYTMLTTPPGPDVAPYHDRQVAVLNRADWPRWLDPAVPARELLGPLPAGTLRVEQVL
jgi:putative SOS response-associated peptidase YedK